MKSLTYKLLTCKRWDTTDLIYKLTNLSTY